MSDTEFKEALKMRRRAEKRMLAAGNIMSAAFIVLLAVVMFLWCRQARAESPKFVTARMMDRRNGLTDEQYELLWAQGKNPQVTQRVARDWVFRASRYQNVTNWLDICGKTNDFAKLSFSLQDWNFALQVTNRVVVATNHLLKVEIEELNDDLLTMYTGLTNQIAKTQTYSNLVVVAQGIAQSAQAKINAELEELQADKADLEEKIADTKYILLRSWLKVKLAAVEARIAKLEALTGQS